MSAQPAQLEAAATPSVVWPLSFIVTRELWEHDSVRAALTRYLRETWTETAGRAGWQTIVESPRLEEVPSWWVTTSEGPVLAPASHARVFIEGLDRRPCDAYRLVLIGRVGP